MKSLFSSVGARTAAQRAALVVTVCGATFFVAHAISSPREPTQDQLDYSLTGLQTEDPVQYVASGNSPATESASIADEHHHSSRQAVSGGVGTARSPLIQPNGQSGTGGKVAKSIQGLESGTASFSGGGKGNGAAANASQGSFGSAGGRRAAGAGAGGGSGGGSGGSAGATSSASTADATTTAQIQDVASALHSERHSATAEPEGSGTSSTSTENADASQDFSDLSSGLTPTHLPDDSGRSPALDFGTALAASTPDLGPVTDSDLKKESNLLLPNDGTSSATATVPDAGNTLLLVAAGLVGLFASASRSRVGSPRSAST
jgi:hypothetical protein